MRERAVSTTDILEDIAEHDPDGMVWEEPTEAKYAAFERWVRQTYGDDMWDHYRGRLWGERGE